ncbi:porin [Pelomonas sp. KK5]|uniref:porin n=1 Tax=Pelomonas sp. KK5 TaxID=1855730 RepID=UPI00097C15D1|nr:porin [Pelomonas sp. KK5]
MIRKIAASTIALGCASLCQAQSVQLYGLIDTGVEYISNVGAGGSRLVRMPSLSGGQFPSRWGVRGTEDLGGGLRAVFTLESGFAPDTGALLQGGRIFGRQAFVGLGGELGTVTAGRQWTMTFFSMLDADVIGPGVFGMAAFDAYLPAARIDNSLSYRGTFSGLSVGATYSLGRDGLAPANCGGEARNGGCKEWSGMIKYDTASWGVALAHDHLDGGPTGTFTGELPGTLPSVDNRDKRTIVNGYLKFGVGTKVGAGWIKRKLTAMPVPLDTDLYFIGLSQSFGAQFSVDAQLLSLRDSRPDTSAKMVLVRGNYALSKRTSLYAMAGRVQNEARAAYSISAGGLQPSTPLAGRDQNGLMVGMRHNF